MSSPAATATPAAAHEGSGWEKLPYVLVVAGLIGLVVGAVSDPKQFGYSYLVAFMFFLSICLGAMFLVILHHLFDSSWSVPIRRFLEHIAFLTPVLGLLFIPIAWLAPQLYPWMTIDPHTDHALHVKVALFNPPTFYIMAAVLFGSWTLLSYKLRSWSLKQDATGAVECTFAMRKWAAGGVFIFAFSLTLAAIYWMKSLQHQFFSTMYGVYYFAGSVWTTLATVYIIAMVMQRRGYIPILHRRQFHDMGVLLFAFTVFYAYIHFSQYFLIWNAAMPEETFWYVLREQGSWWAVGMITVFGHFFGPFLLLLRIDAKLNLKLMIPMAIWVWLMHYLDMQYNIMPVYHPTGIHFALTDLAAMAFIGGTLAIVFLKYFHAHAPYPQKDPRFEEALGHGASSSADAASEHPGDED